MEFTDIVIHYFKYKKVLKELKELFIYFNDTMKGEYYI